MTNTPIILMLITLAREGLSGLLRQLALLRIEGQIPEEQWQQILQEGQIEDELSQAALDAAQARIDAGG